MSDKLNSAPTGSKGGTGEQSECTCPEKSWSPDGADSLDSTCEFPHDGVPAPASPGEPTTSPTPDFDEKRRTRIVTPERAKLAAHRLIDSHFRNPGREHARISIPINLDDDDIVILDFIEQRASVLGDGVGTAREDIQNESSTSGQASRDATVQNASAGDQTVAWLSSQSGSLSAIDPDISRMQETAPSEKFTIIQNHESAAKASSPAGGGTTPIVAGNGMTAREWIAKHIPLQFAPIESAPQGSVPTTELDQGQLEQLLDAYHEDMCAVVEIEGRRESAEAFHAAVSQTTAREFAEARLTPDPNNLDGDTFWLQFPNACEEVKGREFWLKHLTELLEAFHVAASQGTTALADETYMCLQLREQIDRLMPQAQVSEAMRIRAEAAEEELRKVREQSDVEIDNLADYARRFFQIFDMYENAWLREMGGVIVPKHHVIDGFVLRARGIYDKAKLVDRIKRIMVVEIDKKSGAQTMFDEVFKMLAEDGGDKVPTN